MEQNKQRFGDIAYYQVYQHKINKNSKRKNKNRSGITKICINNDPIPAICDKTHESICLGTSKKHKKNKHREIHTETHYNLIAKS